MAEYRESGGAGVIGSNIVEGLVSRGEIVVVLDDLSTGRRENIEPWLERIRFIEGDIRDREKVGEREAFHKLHRRMEEALDKTKYFKSYTW